MPETESKISRRPSGDLSNKQKRHLRGLAHHLNPAVLVGNAGLSAALLKKVSEELEHHELIKVRFGDGAAVEVKAGAQPLVDATGSHLVLVIGKLCAIYRRREKQPEISLPRG